MTDLNTKQLLYLFYTEAYSSEGSVTKSVVKDCLPKDFKPEANSIFDTLSSYKLIESPKQGRFSITDIGRQALIANLKNTTYQFTVSNVPKVLNTLLEIIKQISCSDSNSSNEVEAIDFETFIEKFKKLYVEERKQQELRGVVAIRAGELCQ